MPVKIVTDSTATLPSELVEQRGITVVPLHVQFGTTEYREGVDLTPEGFYDLLETSPVHPTTASPNPAEFKAAYERLGADGDPIVSLHISTELSGTVLSARQAAEGLPHQEIHVIDSRTVIMGLGLLALEAARAATEGAGAVEIRDLAGELAPRTYLIFVIPTLEYLRRGGRIGGAQAFLGSLLNVKPVVAVEGKVEPVARVRSFQKGYAAVAQYVRERAPNGLRCAAVLHADADERRRRLADLMLGEFPPSGEVFPDVPIGPVIGAHTGRGSVGFACIANP